MRRRKFSRPINVLSVTGCALAMLCCALAGCGNVVNSVVAGPSSSSSSASAAVSIGPQLGYLWDAADNTLRPVLGVPGSAQFGQAVTTAGAYVNGAASARSSMAVLQSASGAVSVMAVPAGGPQVLSGASVSGTAQIVFSPSGLNAVLYTPGAASLLLVTGLNTTAQAQSLTAPSGFLAATVSDSAQVAAAYGSGPVSVALLTGNHGTVGSLTGFGGLSFLPGGSDILLADSGSGVVTVVRSAATAPAAQSFTSAAIQSPLAVGGSADGRWAVVANGADASVVRIDLSGATQPLRIACACQPAQLLPMTGNAVFSLTPPGTVASWVADASATTPRTVFIPAVQP